MAYHLGFKEVLPDQSSFTHWKAITVDTGAAQSTLQDIKVPEYGGCYMYKRQTPNTQNRYIFWRVCHDLVELWEESLDIDFTHNHVQLRFADTPVLEGLSIHETNYYVVILLATISSVHRIRLPHPHSVKAGLSDGSKSVFADLSFHSLREYHNLHVLNSLAAGESLPHTAITHLVQNETNKGDAIFVLGQSNGSLSLIQMATLPYAVYTYTIKTASLLNRFFTGFVPTMFKGIEGSETVMSLVLEEFKGEILAFGICFDGRLRAWSCIKKECIMAHNTLENTAEAGRKMTPGAERHLIRSCCYGSSLYLAAFLCYAEKQLIVVYTPTYSMNHLNLQVVKTLYPPQYDLVDLTITSSYIWSLWTDSNNDTKLMYSSVNRNGGPTDPPGLKTAYLEAFPEKEVPLCDPLVDPSETYLKLLLAPNKFSALTLQKALGIYKHNIDVNQIQGGEGNLHYSGLWRLAHEVEAALKEEVQSRISAEMTEEAIADVKLNAWATFYSHTLQYHQVSRKAVSIVPVGGEGLVAVMRKRSVSWIRPLDALELLMLTPQTSSCIAALTSTPILDEDASVATTAVALAKPLQSIRQALDPEVGVAFCLDLLHLEAPDQVALAIATSLLSGAEGYDLDEPLGRVISRQISGVSGIIPGLQAYLRALQLDLGNPDALTLEASLNANNNSSASTPLWLSGAFSSRMGASVLTAVVSQLAQHRLELCRDLFLLQHILLKLNILSPEDKNRIHSTLLSQTTLLTQAYFALMKVSSAPATVPSASCLETSRRQLAALSLTESNFFNSSSAYPATTLELFVLSIGGQHARALVASSLEEKNGTTWAQVLMPLATTVAQLAWPISKCLVLVEFLVWGCQHSAAQEYIRLLQHWCEWNSCSRMFLYGISLLNQGEAWKSQKLLLKASEGVAIEEYLGNRVAGGGPELSLKEAQVQYCLKIIRLLEQSGYPALALEIAKAGIALASTGDPGLAALYSVAFKYHLELGHHDEAFTALMACPDQHSRRNCLRQLIITLYDRKCLSTLVKYNYGTLESEVILILENRARSADILVNNYYDLLFAFHVSKHNFKKGAWVMYECAVRLNVEGLGEKGLELQAKCYLACLNCLNHITADQAWIIKPLPKPNGGEEDHKMDHDDPSNQDSSLDTLKSLKKSKKRPQVEVLELADIEKEYQLVHARLKLYKSQGLAIPLPGGPMSPHDTVSLLVHVKLFRDAIKLCHLYDLPLEPVFEGLAGACIEADRSSDQASHWHWVAQNGISRDKSEGAGWWSLLRVLLQEEEKGKRSHLHKTVTSSILQKCHSVPAWLTDSYKKRNCGELIRVYLCEGLLEEATRLSLNLLDGILGVGTEQMGLDSPLHASSRPVFLPYTVLDHLLLELKEARTIPAYQKLYTDFDRKIKLYLSTLQTVSQDKLLLLE